MDARRRLPGSSRAVVVPADRCVPASTEDVCAVCDSCTVRADCLDMALDKREWDDLDGIYAGTSTGQRVLLRRQRARRAA